MTSPEFIIVGRIHKAHGIRGELVVEAITDAPDAIFASGLRVFAGNTTGDISPARTELHVKSARPFNEGLLVAFTEVPDRNAAELWRGRYLFVPANEVPALEDDEVYLHDLIGMRVTLPGGQAVGTVIEVYELPQGLTLDVRRAPPRNAETVMLQYDERTISAVDKDAGIIVVTPADGLLE